MERESEPRGAGPRKTYHGDRNLRAAPMGQKRASTLARSRGETLNLVAAGSNPAWPAETSAEFLRARRMSEANAAWPAEFR